MFFVIVFCSVVFAIFFGIQLLSFFTIRKETVFIDETVQTNFPKVSLLLAARNEEKLLPRSLRAIQKLNYPSDKLEILIGNDGSTDATETIAKKFCSTNTNAQLINITKNLGKGRGKANVLAQLANEATGEIYFITDVDVELHPNWIKSLVLEFKGNIGIVSGTTTCEPTDSAFSIMQSIDWLHFMGYIQSFANMGVACTSVGNNMAVLSEAYWSTGGYEKIDFSITEDYKLFEEVTKKGWGWSTILTPESLGRAWHIEDPIDMLHQRKRWLIGAKDLPLNWKLMIILYGMFIPSLITMAFISPLIAFCVWVLKFVIQSLYITKLSRNVGLKSFRLYHLFLYELYVVSNTLATALFYFLPVSSVWKGRVYKNNDLT